MTLTAAQQQFLDDAVRAAQATQAEFGVPASVTVAQAIQESTWGQHHIGAADNYFGIKAQTVAGKVAWGTIATGYVSVPTREVINGKSVTVQANFRSYESMTDSFRDHGSFLRVNSRYAPAFATADGIAFARAVAAAGYATDPKYGDSLVAIIRQYNLLQYDTVDAGGGGGTSSDAGSGTDSTAGSPQDSALSGTHPAADASADASLETEPSPSDSHDDDSSTGTGETDSSDSSGGDSSDSSGGDGNGDDPADSGSSTDPEVTDAGPAAATP